LNRTLFGHPPGLAFLFGTEMWERFSYYGMRALLTFYMVDFLFLGAEPSRVVGYGTMKAGLEAVYGPLGPQPLAALIYGLYTALVYLTPLAGGAIADTLIGQRWAVIIGTIVMAAGEFLLMSPAMFFIGLAVLMIGTGFIKPNLSTQVGGLYAPGDSRIDRAYSIFYLGLNIGAFIAPLVCGRLGHSAPGQPQHWYLGFGAAGVGMVLALITYLVGISRLPPDVRQRRQKAAHVAADAGRAPAAFGKREWQAVGALLLVAFFNLFFWAGYEQQGITIALLAQNSTDLHTPIGLLQPEDIQSFNPFFILTLTPVVIAFWSWQARGGREPPPVIKMSIGCALLALGNALMLIPARAVDHGATISVWWLFLSIMIVTAGELYLSPVGLSLFSRAAPARVASLMMGVNFLSNFAGNYMAGYLGHFWERMPHAVFFGMIAGIGAAASVAIFVLGRAVGPVLEDRVPDGAAVPAAA
jgi:POT family proton-dependent oligopeptide transporter